MSENMELWNQVCITDPAVTKAVNIGQRKYTAICAQSQIKRATELWGPMGGAWGIRNEAYDILNNYCIYTAELYFPDGKLPIHADAEVIFSSGKRKDMYNDDFTKKMATDALTKGLSKRGFNADIFEGKFDDNKYVAEQKAKAAAKKKSNEESKAIDPGRQKIIDEIVSILTDKVFTSEDRKEAKKEIDATKINKSLIESIVSLKALKATYQADQNKRIEDFKDDIPMSAEEEKKIDEATESLFPEEEEAAQDLADRKALEEPDIF